MSRFIAFTKLFVGGISAAIINLSAAMLPHERGAGFHSTLPPQNKSATAIARIGKAEGKKVEKTLPVSGTDRSLYNWLSKSMALPDDAAELIKEGLWPEQVSHRLQKPVSEVTRLLYTAVGRGLLFGSDILFTYDEETVEQIESVIEHNSVFQRWDIQKELRSGGVSESAIEEAMLYFDFREAPLTDMYASVCRIERRLHAHIRVTLQSHFGRDHWWNELPLNVRKDCVSAREELERQEDPYSYTTFIHLHDIFKERWTVLSERFPGKIRSHRKQFLTDLRTLNGLRNRTMHPTRHYRPTGRDLNFIQNFAREISADTASDE